MIRSVCQCVCASVQTSRHRLISTTNIFTPTLVNNIIVTFPLIKQNGCMNEYNHLSLQLSFDKIKLFCITISLLYTCVCVCLTFKISLQNGLIQKLMIAKAHLHSDFCNVNFQLELPNFMARVFNSFVFLALQADTMLHVCDSVLRQTHASPGSGPQMVP